MKLSNLRPAKGATHNTKRLGRGQGSGKGGTSTKGHKGDQSRSGFKQKLGFEGGQMPLQRRVPKFGFKNPFRVDFEVINLSRLQEIVEKHGSNVEYNVEFFQTNGYVSNKNKPVKILGNGELSQSIRVSANKFSESAKAAIEKVGGQANEIPSK